MCTYTVFIFRTQKVILIFWPKYWPGVAFVLSFEEKNLYINWLNRSALWMDVLNMFCCAGLCQSLSVCKRQGAGGLCRSWPTNLPLGCEYTNSTDGLKQHCHKWVELFVIVRNYCRVCYNREYTLTKHLIRNSCTPTCSCNYLIS